MSLHAVQHSEAYSTKGLNSSHITVVLKLGKVVMFDEFTLQDDNRIINVPYHSSPLEVIRQLEPLKW